MCPLCECTVAARSLIAALQRRQRTGANSPITETQSVRVVADFRASETSDLWARRMLRVVADTGDSMRVAIAIWNDRISPVFDTSSRLVLVDIEEGKEQGRRVVELGADSFPTRARRLTELEVNVLICGPISRPLAEMVSASGVVVIPWVSAPVEGVVRAYLMNRLSARWREAGVAWAPAGGAEWVKARGGVAAADSPRGPAATACTPSAKRRFRTSRACPACKWCVRSVGRP